jgi:hypothetical protein
MVELADTPDLGSGAVRFGGSSPSLGTPHMSMKNKIVRNRAKCLDCGDIVESTHRHDFVACSCGAMFVDGGKDYLRRGAKDFSKVEDLSEVEEDSVPAK